MSKFVFVIKRSAPVEQDDVELLNTIASRITPDHIAKSATHTLYKNDRIASIVINDKQTFESRHDSLLMGAVLDTDLPLSWEKVGSELPKGDFSLVRVNSSTIEIASNSVASRTIWYVKTADLFIVSSSQRAVVMALGNFEFDKNVIPWVLSTGTIGPCAWDSRVNRVQPGSVVQFDRIGWSINTECNTLSFTPSNLVEQSKLKRKLFVELKKAINSLRIDEGWILPISGGYDSRGILCFLVKNKEDCNNIRTVTWGSAGQLNVKTGDAHVASKLTKTLSVPHEILSTDFDCEETPEAILLRFIKASEGRIDHFSGYADGLRIWKKLHENSIKGIIRGDEGFGWTPVTSEHSVRVVNGCGLCTDFVNLSGFLEKYNLKQKFPEDWIRMQGETLEAWRDRLYHNFRIPTVLAALSDIKLSYVEQVNPLLFDNVLSAVRLLPDELREDKALFKDIVNEISPPVEYASDGSNTPLAVLLNSPPLKSEMVSKLQLGGSSSILPKGLVEEVLARVEKTNMIKSNSLVGQLRSKLFKRVKKVLPTRLKRKLRDTVAKPSVPNSILLFRLYIIVQMHKILSEDARSTK